MQATTEYNQNSSFIVYDEPGNIQHPILETPITTGAVTISNPGPMSTAYTKKRNHPAINEEHRSFKTEDLTNMTYPELEATIATEMDRANKIAEQDPLLALDQATGLIQIINFELYKNYAPVVMENARIMNDKFLATGKMVEDKREGNRTFNQFQRLQEGIVKLGIGQTKIREELERRDAE